MSLLSDRQWQGKIFVNTWVDGADSRDIVEPATGDVLGSLGLGSPDDMLRAAREAARAQSAWAARPPQDRAEVLRRAGDLWREHADDVASWLVREAGSIPAKAQLETESAAQLCYEAAALATHPRGEVLASAEPRWSVARRTPVGVVSVIAPFNFPLILAIRSVAPALALGNAVLLKPDPRTGVSGGVALLRILQAAGLPDGVLQLVPGDARTGEAAVTAPEVRVVAFTGSTEAGRAVGALAGQHLKRAHLELGGNNALIVLPGADVPAAASAGAFGSFMHQGQICMTTGRHLVHESLHDAYVEALAEKAGHLPVGNPATEQVALGPIIDHRQLGRIDRLVQDTLVQGARLAAGGTYEGLFYRPTVLSGVKPGMPAYAQEVFGPVAPVIPFASAEEAIALARDCEYGLSLGILGDIAQAMRIADAVPSGIVHINEQTVADEAVIPFGGVGASGNGSRVGGATANADAFTETQWLTIRGDIAPYPF
ncbi:benzaldehyde dehydrogenase [Streptomyces sp. NPDC056716]|uniref:benzaldehyde dehydrogenase n=1 Tax=unclassified Streptomyces TaxID=2593676 RepID=UPI00367812B8